MDFWTKGANGGKFDTAATLTSQIDVITLLGHKNHELSLRGQEAIKPNLNKKYGFLCSSQTLVTTLLFEDKLQAQPQQQLQLFLQPFLVSETGQAFFRQRSVPAQMEAKTVEEKGGAQQKINEHFTLKLNSLQVTGLVGSVITTSEISILLEKIVIAETTHEPGEFISSVFGWPKKDRSHQMILNLKNLNNHMPLVRTSLESQGILAEDSRLIIQSSRSGTTSYYQTYYKKWELFVILSKRILVSIWEFYRSTQLSWRKSTGRDSRCFA